MALVEYLYVDERRLDTYFEQISSPVTYDKVPVWEASLTITSPGAKGTQQRFARPYTTHEKITKFTEYLEGEGLVAFGRGSGEGLGPLIGRRKDNKLFRIETCQAKRVFIPPDHGQPPDVGALNIWISAVPRTRQDIERHIDRLKTEGPDLSGPAAPGNLYLLEDDRRPDEQHYHVRSAYSALSLMIENNFAANMDYGTVDPGNQRGYFEGLINPHDDFLNPQALPEATDLQIQFLRDFLFDPTLALADIGAQIGPERKIRTLYRVRGYFPEEETFNTIRRWEISTFGYPIFIAEDTDPV
jgi:hypothetical protein